MKRIILWLVLILVFTNKLSFAKTLIVDNDPNCLLFFCYSCKANFVPDNPYTSIQDAINAATAGDTIEICNGTYYESLITKDNQNGLIIKAADGQDNVTLISNGDGVTASQNTNSVHLESFTIEAQNNAINYPYNAGSFVVLNMTVKAGKYALYANNVYSRAIIDGLKIINAANGIYLKGGNNGKLQNSCITNITGTGVEIYNNNSLEVTNNCFINIDGAEFIVGSGSNNTNIHDNFWEDEDISGGSDSNPLDTCPNNCSTGGNTFTTPIVEYRMDECEWSGISGEVKDSSGNGYDATAQNGATTVEESQICKGGDFTNSKYIIPDTQIPINSNYTLFLWIKFPLDTSEHTIYREWGKKFQYFNIADRPTSDKDFIYFKKRVKNNNNQSQWMICVDDDSGTQCNNFNMNLTGWHFIAFTVSENETKIYIDGNYQDVINKAPKGYISVIGSSDFNDDYEGQTIGSVIDEFKIFDKIFIQSEIQQVYNNEKNGKNWDGSDRNCPPCNQLDHYEIVHDGSALTCQPKVVTIKACTDSNYPCSEYSSETSVTLNYNSASENYTFTGHTSASVIHHTPETISLSLTNMSPNSVNGYKCINTSDGSNSCNITFYDSGFIFDIQNEYSCKPQVVEIKAVRKDDQSIKCVPGFQNVTIPVDFTFNYLSPNSGNKKPVINNNDLNATVDLTFDNNGVSSFEIFYPDAGEINITASFDNSTHYAVGSDTAVFKPYGFYIYSTDTDWKADNGANSSVFKKAGETFNLSAKAVCWQSDNDSDLSDNLVTENYNKSGLQVSHTLTSPTSRAAGSIGIHQIDFSNGIASTVQTFSEVGIIKFTITDSDYLGSGIVQTTSENFGRFIPHHFVITDKTDGILKDSCNNFIYTGQSTTYLQKPSFKIEAQNSGNTITQNYKDDFFKLDISGIQIISPQNDDNKLGSDNSTKVKLSVNRATANLYSNNDGTATYTYGFDNITYLKDSNSKVAPFTPHFTFLIDNITDSDGVFLDNKDNITVSGSIIKYGIMKILNNYGPETENLTLTVKNYYFDGNFWKVNEDDTCTSLSSSDFVLDNYTGNLESGETDILSTNGINNGLGEINLSAPGENNFGTVDVCISSTANFYSYLSDNSSCGTATFGIYRGRDRVIEWLEIPPN